MRRMLIALAVAGPLMAGPSGLFDTVWTVLSSIWEESSEIGCGLDPDGCPKPQSDIGCGLDPDGCPKGS
jgi:hypothetical protein